MATRAFVFPGQGSQYVGMAQDIYEADSSARAMMERADQILGIPFDLDLLSRPGKRAPADREHAAGDIPP